MDSLRVVGRAPPKDLFDALLVVARELNITTCYAHLGRYHFSLGSGWSLSLSSESAGRVRVESCKLTRPASTMWCMATDSRRLTSLARSLSQAALVA